MEDKPVPPNVLAEMKKSLENVLEEIGDYDVPFEQALVHSKLALTFDYILQKTGYNKKRKKI